MAETTSKKVVQLGAGNIGRGFLGQLYWQSGYEIVFVDVNRALVEAINARGGYEIHVVGPRPAVFAIRRARALDAADVESVAREIAQVGVMGVSVGQAGLPDAARLIAAGIRKRILEGQNLPLNIIICENLLDAAAAIRSLIETHLSPEEASYLAARVGLVESVVSRMVPVITQEKRRADPLFVAVEEYSILPVDRTAFVGEVPPIKGLEPKSNFTAYEELKLFTHNCGHALCAYFGYEKGLTYIWESVGNAEVCDLVSRALWEVGRALIRKHAFTEEEHRAHIEDLLARFANRPLGDTVARVGRDPIRKLGPRDRLVGAAHLALGWGVEPRVLAEGIGSALRYDNPEDGSAAKLGRLLEVRGIEHVLRTICSLDPEEKLFRMAKKAYDSGPPFSQVRGRRPRA